mgnify:CR=1 FL=1
MPYRILASSILVIFLSTTSSLAERVALVIGNSEYERVQRLSNPVNDAKDVGASLERIGFEVTTLLNANRSELNQSLSTFARKARGSEMAIVYFAGHGMEIDNSNYLLPVDADIRDPLDVAFEGIEMSQFLRVVEGAETLKLVLLDACRDNPFLVMASGGTRSLRRGLARIEPPGGVLVGYAARGGTVAYDGEGRNSPYASALIQNLETPGLEIGKLFRLIRDRVFTETEGKQEPFTYGSLPAKDIYLVAAKPNDDSANDVFKDFAQADLAGSVDTWREFINKYGSDPRHLTVADRAREKLAVLQSALAQPSRETVSERNNQNNNEIRYRAWLEIGDEHSLTGEIFLPLESRKLVQKSLNMLGYDTDGVDGIFGPATRRAISAARYKVGVVVGDHLDRSFLERLPDVYAIEAMMSQNARPIASMSFPLNMEKRLLKASQVLGDQPAVFGYFRGHLYVAVLPTSDNRGWVAGSLLARRMDGHLATLTSQEENDFVFEMIRNDSRFFEVDVDGNFNGPLFGLFQPEGSKEPRGGWVWITGEELKYSNWLPRQPDDIGQKSMRAAFFLRGQNGKKVARDAGRWNDTSGFYYSSTYVIEIE